MFPFQQLVHGGFVFELEASSTSTCTDSNLDRNSNVRDKRARLGNWNGCHQCTAGKTAGQSDAEEFHLVKLVCPG